MSITFPRPLPSYRLSRATFNLVAQVASAASHHGAKLNMTMIGSPVWHIDVETVPLWDDERREWTAWVNSLRGGLKSFLAHDVTRKPRAYPGAKKPADIASGWDGTAVVTSLGAAGALGLSSLPANYKIRVGDRIGILSSSGHRGYYEALEDVTANSSGAATVTVSPFLHTSIFAADDVATLWLPNCQFSIDWQSWSEVTTGGPTPISFRGVQRVMA